jgi:hypothetical protein
LNSYPSQPTSGALKRQTRKFRWACLTALIGFECLGRCNRSVHGIPGADLPQLMLALAHTAGHSGRSLTTTYTYETIPYLLHCSPSCSWLLNVVMRQQDRIDDDQQHERGGHEEVEHDRAGHQEVDHDQKEVVQEKDGHRSVAVTYSVTARFAAQGRGSQHFGEGASYRRSPLLKMLALPGWG